MLKNSLIKRMMTIWLNWFHGLWISASTVRVCICWLCDLVVDDLTKQGQLLREILFYSSYRINGENDHHPSSFLTDRNERILKALQFMATSGKSLLFLWLIDSNIASLASEVLHQNQLGPIVLITPELGKWSTVGGLGVMVDNLSKALAKQGQEIIVFSPYYDRNRYGQTE